jgi:hypothetical protein
MLGLGVFNNSRNGLAGPDPSLVQSANASKYICLRLVTYYASDDCALWECFPEWFLVADAVLYDNERCPRFINDR